MRVYLWIGMIAALGAIGGCNTDVTEQDADASESSPEVQVWPRDSSRPITALTVERGLKVNTPAASAGYVLFQPSLSTLTYLMDKSGNIVHSWKGDLNSMQSYLLPNGHLMRVERDIDFPVFAAGGQSGRIKEYTWAGELVWDFEYATDKHLTHHDIEPLPNGNVLAIAYEVKSREEAIAAGRDPEHVAPAGIWPDKIIEIKPTGPADGEIVWEWKMWDHLIQDINPDKDNYGVLSENPRKININVYSDERELSSKEQIDQMKQMGMLTSNATYENQTSDISHVNAIDYNEELDQIVFSSPGYSEIFIIDHSTTTDEARGGTGGRWGHGGDLLYRWGNPENYGRGTEEDRTLYEQHDIRWIQKGLQGEGHLMVFNNDIPGPNSKLPSVFMAFMDSVKGFNPDPYVSVGDWSNYSAVIEFEPPIDKNGAYVISDKNQFGPENPEWTYVAPDTFSLYSPFVSGAHRLPGGNTFIIMGAPGRFIEVTPRKETVWDYWQPYVDDYKLPDGSPAQPNGPFMFAQFRAAHISPDYSGLEGKELVALEVQPEHFVFTPPPPPPGAMNENK